MTAILKWPTLRLLVLVAIWVLVGSLRACDAGAQSPASVDVARRPPGFAEVYSYTDGLEVRVSDVSMGRRLGVPVADVTVTVVNSSDHAFEAWISGDLRYGRYRLPAVRYVTPPGPDDSGSVQYVAVGGTSDPYRLSFVVPPGSPDDVMLTVAIDAGLHDPAVFAGRL